MKKRRLNYRFHNPNSEAATADYILKIFIEANARKVEAAIREAAELPPCKERSASCKGHSA